MNKKVVIAAFVVLGAVALGLGGYLLLDDGKPRPGQAKSGKGDRAATADQLATQAQGDLPSREPALGTAVLSPEQEALLKASLESVARDSSERDVLQGGVPKPWPLPAARETFRICLGSVENLVDTKVPGAAERACACATRAVQRDHPGKPPNTDTRTTRRAFEREVKGAVEACTGN